MHLRYFAGLSVEEAAQALGISRTYAYRQWMFARAWLLQAPVRRRTDLSRFPFSLPSRRQTASEKRLPFERPIPRSCHG
jgi:hypothetical protein